MLDRVRSNGVVGAGGAGFPTYKKLESSAEIVIVNAAECEPLLHKDKEILHHHMDEVLEGMVEVMQQVNSSRGIIAIKQKHHELIAKLESVAAKRSIAVHPLEDFYPAGDEFITVFETTGRVIPPGGIPLDVGCLVMNVETMLNVHLDEPVTHKFLTVAGDVPRPVTVRLPVGTKYRDVLRTVGVEPDEVGHVLISGVMMGQLMKSFDEVVTRTTGALICFPEGHRLPLRYMTDARARHLIGKSACDQCSFCTEMCPRYLLGHPVEPHLATRGLEFNMVGESMILGSQFCCECNLCSLFACPEDLYPKDACTDNKRMMKERGLKHPATGKADVKPHSMQQHRRIPVASLIKKLGLAAFQDVGPLLDIDWTPEEVRIPMGQYAGEPALPRVQVGDRVEAGREIGAAPSGLGVPVHASVGGVITAVGNEVVIRRSHA
ncbi:MAG: 4Fe-4S dicluster domain-containing protein [Acidobacteriota bacterium]